VVHALYLKNAEGILNGIGQTLGYMARPFFNAKKGFSDFTREAFFARHGPEQGVRAIDCRLFPLSAS
jgi:hypothetical protein